LRCNYLNKVVGLIFNTFYKFSLNEFLDFLSAIRYLTAERKQHSYIKWNEERFCTALRDERKENFILLHPVPSSTRTEVQNKVIFKTAISLSQVVSA